jgi:hypothetical protein
MRRRQVLEQIRCGHQEQGDSERANYSGQLCSSASSFRHGVRDELLLIGKP